MSRIAYVNGRYVRHKDAMISIEDRGFQFADGVYEVVAIVNGCPVDLKPHFERLDRSMSELRFSSPPNRSTLAIISREVVRRNRVRDGILYMQVNRGQAPRDHVFPLGDRECSVVMTARSGLGPNTKQRDMGVTLVIQDDQRWLRRDVKSVGLLANALTKQAAKEKGAFESLLVNPDGTVTEASAANLWFVDKDGTLVTRPLGPEILGGITRARVMALAQEAGYKIREAVFTVDDVLSAKEVFLTGTTTFVLPVVQIDEAVISNGHPGEATRDLGSRYETFLRSLKRDSSWRVS